MHPAQIKAALEMNGVTQAKIADQCGVASSSVNDVVHGRKRSQQIELRIAVVTQRTLKDLWPQWYGPGAAKRRRAPTSPAPSLDALRAVMG